VVEPGGAAEASDASLLARLGAGDAAALDAMLDRYWEPVFRYAWRMTDSRDAASDLAQEVFCRLWERRASWSSEGSVRGLVFRLARNEAVSRHRRGRARDRAQRGYAELYVTTDDGPSAAERAELRDALESAVDALPARRREVFLFRMMDGLSYDEIAAVMRISRQTVANQLSRALATLRADLADLLGT
jgi:RNA polymerase sigma-70 factor (ECF subfamily)